MTPATIAYAPVDAATWRRDAAMHGSHARETSPLRAPGITDPAAPLCGHPVADHLPLRVLPVGSEPPQDFQTLIDREYENVAALLKPHRRARADAEARIRALLAMEAHVEPDARVSVSDVRRVATGVRAGKTREQVFPRLGLDRVEDSEAWVTLGDAGRRPRIAFQQVTDYQAPDWGSSAIPQQMHIDVLVENLDDAQAAVLELGATLLDGSDKPIGYRVYADPAGHPFCLVTPEGLT